MFKKKFIHITPAPAPTFQEQALDYISLLDAALKENNIPASHILKQSIFLKANGNPDFFAKKTECLSLLETHFGPQSPPSSIVAEAPASGAHVAVELTVLDDSDPHIQIQHKELDGSTYITVGYPGVSANGHAIKEVYGAGLTSGQFGEEPFCRARIAFEKMARILEQEGLEFRHVVRQWNYIEDITGSTLFEGKHKQNYQLFNDARSIFYSTSSFKNGYPAATGIGMDCGGVVLDFIAVNELPELAVVAIKNPQQEDAHRYSQEVLVGDAIEELNGKTTPKFERAKIVEKEQHYILYISGTAAIRGQETVALGDIDTQTRITIENIEKLIAQKNLEAQGSHIKTEPGALHSCRVYVKEPSDYPAVERICRDYYKGVPITYLIAGVCRLDLLVEIEGVVLG